MSKTLTPDFGEYKILLDKTAINKVLDLITVLELNHIHLLFPTGKKSKTGGFFALSVSFVLNSVVFKKDGNYFLRYPSKKKQKREIGPFAPEAFNLYLKPFLEAKKERKRNYEIKEFVNNILSRKPKLAGLIGELYILILEGKPLSRTQKFEEAAQNSDKKRAKRNEIIKVLKPLLPKKFGKLKDEYLEGYLISLEK